MKKQSVPDRHSRYYRIWEHQEKKRRKKRRKRMVGAAAAVLCMVTGIFLAWFLLSAPHSDQLEGTWRFDDATSYQFDGKGSGFLMASDEPYSFRYLADEGRLRLDFEETAIGSVEYEFSIEESELILRDIRTDQYFRLNRGGGA